MTTHWNHPGLPHKGYRCVDVVDSGEPRETCEMCSHPGVRFLHVLQHDDLPNAIRVGCECAEKLVEGYDAKRCEAEVKSRAARRSKWLIRSGWWVPKSGSYCLKLKRWTVGVAESRRQPGWWSWFVLAPDFREWSPKSYATRDEARLALFDRLNP